MAIRFALLLLTILCNRPTVQHHHLLLCYAQEDNPTTGCPADERQALVELKSGAVDPAGRLSSWSGEDCCQWKGVHCDNRMGHVVAIDLRNQHQYEDPNFGEIIANSSWALQCHLPTSSLLALKHLNFLDLSGNYFIHSGSHGHVTIPQFLGSFPELRYLNLSLTNFAGTVPHHLGNLSRLHTLSLLVDSGEDDGVSLVMKDTHWLSGLTSLQHFEIRYATLGHGWIQALNMLTSMRQIHVSDSVLGDSSLSLQQVNFTSLSILDLPGNVGLSSTILSWLPNLTSLQYLDLSENYIQGILPSAFWNISSLEILIMPGNQIESTMVEASVNLRRLQELDMTSNLLTGHLPDNIGNLASLRYLRLSENALSGKIPASIGNLSKLLWLDLSGNTLIDVIPESITNLGSLEHILLFGNLFSGPIPRALGGLSSLQKLDLSGNRLQGTVPESLGQLSELVHLDLGGNLLSTFLTEAHFARLARLQYLYMSNNSMVVLNLSSGWLPPFELSTIDLGGCQLGPRFPQWLRTQFNISYLDLSHAGISDSIPDWLWRNKSRFWYLNLSHNKIYGKIANSLLGPLRTHVTFDLHSNHLEGPLPHDIQNVDLLDLSYNSFSGTVPRDMWKSSSFMRFLLLSNNNLTGTIPLSLCKLRLQVLDLSGNHLSGELPNCHAYPYSYILDLSSNDLSGEIPDAFLNVTGLHSLFLSNNNFSGEVPSILMGCTMLSILDLGNNKFNGGIPIWLDDRFTNLRVLLLRSNLFNGFIPHTLSQLSNLQILDLSQNDLSGAIPKSFGNFTAMMRQNDQEYDNFVNAFTNQVILNIKGRNLEYARLLQFLAAIDLSENNLSGIIPRELANLTWLQSLNLSGNYLAGEIGAIIGGLQRLESLDLSRNKLSGPIPPTIANLSSLGFLNLSYNNFSGRIPSGGHLDTFDDASVYMGNPYLYGISSIENNNSNKTIQGIEDEDEDGKGIFVFYLSFSLGFVVWFWIVFGVLVLKNTWRHAYFQFMDNTCDKIYVRTTIFLRKFKLSLLSRVTRHAI